MQWREKAVLLAMAAMALVYDMAALAYSFSSPPLLKTSRLLLRAHVPARGLLPPASPPVVGRVHETRRFRLRGGARSCPASMMSGTERSGTIEIPASCPDAAALLSRRWRELVAGGKISSETSFEGTRLRYGLRMDARGGIEEFVEDAEEGGESDGSWSNCRSLYKEDRGVMVKLVSSRRLRPPAAFNRSQRRVFPPHDDSCSLCYGAISLPLREKAAVVALPEESGGRRWDFHYNIAPIESRGHFLVVPDMTKEDNCREQKLLLRDCIDMGAMSKQLGGVCLNFNSPNAGATQNHIHLHAWKQDYVYIVEGAREREGTWQFGEVSVRELEYPAFCVKISNENPPEHVGKVVHTILEAASEDPDLSWNLVFSNGYIYLFLRISEVAPVSLPGFAFGCNQMMGFWNVDTEDQFDMVNYDTVMRALEETSVASSRGRDVISRAQGMFQTASSQ
mmetsp:Transcript_28028/g.90929  ORF Transcript_28028/g.90929 Transcript_28028/m.90929 type:complete len:451 (-) Transcript_28028:365-1717(-)